jgi:hypothetical protein
MISRHEAQDIMVRHLLELETDAIPLVLLEEHTMEEDFGWVFFWTSKKYLETGADEDMLLGNCPLIVDNEDGSIHDTGTAQSIEYYIEEYRAKRE